MLRLLGIAECHEKKVRGVLGQIIVSVMVRLVDVTRQELSMEKRNHRVRVHTDAVCTLHTSFCTRIHR